MLSIDIANTQTELPVDEGRLHDAVRMILEDHRREEARISVAVVDDATITALHEKYLAVAGPTDVLSFVLESSPKLLEGEVITSAETAMAVAPQYGWPAADELLLYVIHGMLHLVGYDDVTAEKQAEMRGKEQQYLTRFGLNGHYD